MAAPTNASCMAGIMQMVQDLDLSLVGQLGNAPCIFSPRDVVDTLHKVGHQ